MIKVILPLPPSKNKRTVRKGVRVKGKFINVPVLSPEVLAYRQTVQSLLRGYTGVFMDGVKIVLSCVWYKTRKNQDCANYHDELCDAVAPALGLNDKFFLIRDEDYFIVPKNEGCVRVKLEVKND